MPSVYLPYFQNFFIICSLFLYLGWSFFRFLLASSCLSCYLCNSAKFTCIRDLRPCFLWIYKIFATIILHFSKISFVLFNICRFVCWICLCWIMVFSTCIPQIFHDVSANCSPTSLLMTCGLWIPLVHLRIFSDFIPDLQRSWTPFTRWF